MGEHRLTLGVKCGLRKRILGELSFVVNKERFPAYASQLFGVSTESTKQERLQRLLPTLRCTLCKLGGLEIRQHALTCLSCAANFQLANQVPLIVVDPPRYPVNPEDFDTPISNNPYAEIILSRLEPILGNNGLILEVGSGHKLYGMRNIIQLEISRYSFTDIVNQNEELPFKDASFECVFSLAVTEHVEKPWQLAAEMQRILKPGGLLIVDCAFMQPLHGFPNHYFNMTAEGLGSLFPQIAVESLKAESHQDPWFAVEASLRYLLTKAPQNLRNLLEGMTLVELWEESKLYITGKPGRLATLPLGRDLMQELSAGFTLIGHKKMATASLTASTV